MEKVDLPAVVVYRAFARKGCHSSKYPIRSIMVENEKGKRALLRLTFAVEHIFGSELCTFLKSLDRQFSKLQIKMISLTPEPLVLDRENQEVLTCVFLYTGNKNLGVQIEADRFIKEIAKKFGNPSMEAPASLLDLSALPAFTQAMAYV